MIKESKNCPICNTPLSQEILRLKQKERQQGGKNIRCPNCNFLLWIHANGPPQSVPIFLKKLPYEKFPNASTSFLESRKGLL